MAARTASSNVPLGSVRTPSGKEVNKTCTQCQAAYHSSSGLSTLCPRCRPSSAPGAARAPQSARSAGGASKDFAPVDTSKLLDGDRRTLGTLELGKPMCVVIRDLTSRRDSFRAIGALRFWGETEFAHGIWFGVELLEKVGKNDGSVGGVRYFECEDGFGIFVRSKSLRRITREETRRLHAARATPTPARRPPSGDGCTRVVVVRKVAQEPDAEERAASLAHDGAGRYKTTDVATWGDDSDVDDGEEVITLLPDGTATSTGSFQCTKVDGGGYSHAWDRGTAAEGTWGVEDDGRGSLSLLLNWRSESIGGKGSRSRSGLTTKALFKPGDCIRGSGYMGPRVFKFDGYEGDIDPLVKGAK